MKHTFVGIALMVIAVFVSTALSVPAQSIFATQSTVPAQSAQPAPPQAGAVQPQMRGPLHESFASPFVSGPQEALTVPKQPPAPLEEEPAEIVPPDGSRQPQWIPGYWTFEEGQGWIWVSGTWRYPPPQRRWVPGSWAPAETGWQWSPGFWAPSAQNDFTYLPPPPPPRNIAPTVAAPAPGCFWVPGCWIYASGRYSWRAGFWARGRADYVWVPARYYRTPRGYIFIDGYWDIPPLDRGLLFAPVVCTGIRPVRYRPSVVLQFDSLFVHLFARPRAGHYCFGDYYDSVRPGRGYYSWVSFGAGPSHYDPMMIWFQVNRRNYVRNVAQRHNHYVSNRSSRPARRWSDYRRQALRGNAGRGALGLSVNVVLKGSNRNKYRRASSQQLRSAATRAKALRSAAAARTKRGPGRSKSAPPRRKSAARKIPQKKSFAPTRKKTGSAPRIRPAPKGTTRKKTGSVSQIRPVPKGTKRKTPHSIQRVQPAPKGTKRKSPHSIPRFQPTPKRQPRSSAPKGRSKSKAPPARFRNSPVRGDQSPVRRSAPFRNVPRTQPKRTYSPRPQPRPPVVNFQRRPSVPHRAPAVRSQPRIQHRSSNARRRSPPSSSARRNRSNSRSRQSSRRRR